MQFELTLSRSSDIYLLNLQLQLSTLCLPPSCLCCVSYVCFGAAILCSALLSVKYKKLFLLVVYFYLLQEFAALKSFLVVWVLWDLKVYKRSVWRIAIINDLTQQILTKHHNTFRNIQNLTVKDLKKAQMNC